MRVTVHIQSFSKYLHTVTIEPFMNNGLVPFGISKEMNLPY